jgi:hypothetical protein
VVVSIKRRGKFSCSQAKKVCGMLQCCHSVFCYEMFGQNRPVCWSIVVKEKPKVGSSFFGAFPSDLIAKMTKYANVHLFIYSSSSCKLYQRIPGTFWSYVYQKKNVVVIIYVFIYFCLLIANMKICLRSEWQRVSPNLTCLSLLYECNFILILIPP